MDFGKEFEEKVKGLDFQSLSDSKPTENLLKSIDFTRPLNEYPAASDIAIYVKMREGSRHVYTDSLNVNGIAVQDSFEKYLSAHDYYSSGQLKAALKTPLHLFYERDSGWRFELEKWQKGKGHYNLGTYLHQCVLEATKFSRVLVEPKYSLSTTEGVENLTSFWEDKIHEIGEVEVKGKIESAEKALQSALLAVDEMKLNIKKLDGKKAYLNIMKSISGLQSVSEEHKIIIDIVRVNYMRYGDGILPEIMKHSKREISLYYIDPSTGLKVRVRPDAMQFAENIGCNAVISVKSTRAESISHFAYQSAQLTYELSEGMYLDVASGVTGRDFNTTIMIMLQTVAPYGVAALVWNGEDIEIGKYKYRQALQTAYECEQSKIYPGYDAYAESGNLGLINFKQPSWNAKELLPVDLEA